MEKSAVNWLIKKIGIFPVILGILTVVSTVVLIFGFPSEEVVCLEEGSTYNRNQVIIPYQGKWEQEIAVKENFDAIEIRLATYYQEYERGSLHVQISEKNSGTVLRQAAVPASLIRDNQFLHIDLGEVRVKRDSAITMEFWMEEFDDQALALYCTEETDSLIIKLLQTNKKINFHKIGTAFSVFFFLYIFIYFIYNKFKDILINTKTKELFKNETILRAIVIITSSIWCMFLLRSLLSLEPIKKGWYTGFFVITFIVLILTAVSIRKIIADRVEIIVALTIILMGSFLSVVFPLGAISWDDHIHYTNALATSHIYTGKATTAETWYQTPFIDNVQDINEVSNSKKELNQLYKEKIYQPIEDSLNWYGRLCYTPAAIFMFLGRLLRMPAHALYYMGRLGNVFLYAMLIYGAVRRLKSGKMILAIIALIPTNLFLLASFSYDPWVTGFMICGISYIISELQQPEKRFSIKEIICMLGAFILMGSAKAIYFPMVLLAFFVRKNKFADTKEYKRYCCSVIITTLFLILSFAVPILVKTGSLTDIRGGTDVNGLEQIKFILKNPLDYLKILFSFLKDYMSISGTGGYMTFFAYLGSGAKLEVILVLLGITAVTDKNESDCNISYWYKYGTFFLVFVTACFIATALYITFTPVAAEYIAGCQPRYLMPLLFPLLCIAGSKNIENKINKTCYNIFIYTTILYILANSFWKGCIMLYQ